MTTAQKIIETKAGVLELGRGAVQRGPRVPDHGL